MPLPCNKPRKSPGTDHPVPGRLSMFHIMRARRAATGRSSPSRPQGNQQDANSRVCSPKSRPQDNQHCCPAPGLRPPKKPSAGNQQDANSRGCSPKSRPQDCNRIRRLCRRGGSFFALRKTFLTAFRGRERSDQRKAAKNSTEWPKGHSVECASAHQYMPPMSPPAAGAAGAGAGMSATRDSVVSTIAATEAAFCSAERVTLVGSIMPRSIMSTYSSFSAS